MQGISIDLLALLNNFHFHPIGGWMDFCRIRYDQMIIPNLLQALIFISKIELNTSNHVCFLIKRIIVEETKNGVCKELSWKEVNCIKQRYKIKVLNQS